MAITLDELISKSRRLAESGQNCSGCRMCKALAAAENAIVTNAVAQIEATQPARDASDYTGADALAFAHQCERLKRANEELTRRNEELQEKLDYIISRTTTGLGGK